MLPTVTHKAIRVSRWILEFLTKAAGGIFGGIVAADG
jgi:hypothetical protein